jgi:hypothetical protein
MKSYLPIPEKCDNCLSSNIIYVSLRKTYLCLDCGASTRCHPDSKIPLGKMADAETRRLRKLAHLAFDTLWQNRYMERTRAYFWLACELSINPIECHIGWLTKNQLEKTIAICNEYISSNIKALERRRIKNSVKFHRRSTKTANRINRRKSTGY